MKGKKNTLFVLALLLLVGLTSGYVANTYARYASAIPTKTAKATVAKWSFKADNETQTIAINLAETPDPSTLIGDRIAPGTSGSFNIKLVNTNTETGVDFAVKLTKPVNAPKNLKFYYKTSEADTNKIELTDSNSNTVTGQLKATDGEGVTIPFYWEWAIGENSEVENQINKDDTAAGEVATAEGLTIGVDITGVQTQPFNSDGSANVIANSHIN